MKASKQKKCRVCGAKFSPMNSLAKVCSLDCSVKYAKKEVEKRERNKIRVRKDLLKSRGDWLREAQTEFNKFIRFRDYDQPCISCDKPNTGQHQRHASHFRSVGGNPELRFNELNVWASCAQCNGVMSGNLLEYRIRLVKKIGADKVAWLEGPHEPQKLSIEDIKLIKKEYAAKARELQKARQ